MKNKRYKRIAKRLKGTCLNNCIKYTLCSECEEYKNCAKYVRLSCPFGLDIKTLEGRIKGR